MTALIFFSGLTKRNRASRDKVCNWTDRSAVQVLSLTDRLQLVYTLLRDHNLIFQPFFLILKRSDRVFSFSLLNFCRAAFGFNWMGAFWGSAGLPEKEPCIKWHLLQRPGHQTANKSGVSAAHEICLENWGCYLSSKFVSWTKKETRKQTIVKI